MIDDDLERAGHYKLEDVSIDHERESLLSSLNKLDVEPMPTPSRGSFKCCSPTFRVFHLGVAFLAGLIACLSVQYLIGSPICRQSDGFSASKANLADSDAGSTERHHFPPSHPTNAFPTYFPTSVGYAGTTHTGAEPALVVTAPSYPIHTGAAQLVIPEYKHKGKKFDLFKKWGNLSPWYSNERGAFGVDSGPEPPRGCELTGLHLLHRHGARYPTSEASYAGPAKFATRLHGEVDKWNATGPLEFLNHWTYKLGEEVLTPFGRQQLFDLGVSMRLKYGFLLKNFTSTNALPVFRTESQARMLNSAWNFALGFFGYPLDGKYHQSITIEAHGFNNTLAPYMTCPNSGNPDKADRGAQYTSTWANVYLKSARARLARHLEGFELSIEDTYALQEMCAYETLALGFSKFCGLFTEEEWDGFDYSLDLHFWYSSAFGAPLASSLGIGYVQELVARLTHTPIEIHKSSTNSTLDDSPITFPLHQSLYVDATHEVVILNILTALNLTNFAEAGPLPADRIPEKRTFMPSRLSPFASNVQFQLLECAALPSPQIRIIINDAPSPLTSISGCPPQKDGMCPIDTFVQAQKKRIEETDWVYDCHGNWTIPEGWETVEGKPPGR